MAVYVAKDRKKDVIFATSKCLPNNLLIFESQLFLEVV